MKYVRLKIFPINSYGASTGLAPTHVNIVKDEKNIQEYILLMGFVFVVFFIFFIVGKIKMMRIDIKSAITPLSLLGIERKIAYANKKYHSGWM